MDIDDILASVDVNVILQEKRDLQQLTRAWVTERGAPEILPWSSELIDRVLERITKQIELVEEQTGNPDPKTNFRLIIMQTELERFKYLVRSFLRTRIAKASFPIQLDRSNPDRIQIDAHPLHYLSNPAAKMQLSPSETQYLTTHTALLHQHYHSCFLSQFPPSLQKVEDRAAGGISAAEEGPDVDKAVFVRALRDMGEEVEVPGTDIRLEMRMGDVFVVRWNAVRALVLDGVCEVI